MKNNLKILFVEDSPDDIELMLLEFDKKKIPVDWKRVQTKKELNNELKSNWDLVISDYVLPGFSGPEALEIIREKSEYLPVIIVSGTIGEDIAVDTLKLGATDYLMKSNLKRLVPSVERAIEEYNIKIENQKVFADLEESEQRYKSIFNNKHTVMLIVEPKYGKIIDANQAACDYYGWNREQLINMKMSDINKLPEKELQSKYKEALNGKTSLFLHQHYLANGNMRDVEIYSGPIRIKSETFLFSIIHDITKRKKAEEEINKLAHAIKSIQECVTVTDLNNNLLFANESFLETYGYTMDEIIGKKMDLFLSPKDKPEIQTEILNKTLKGGWEGELWNIRKDGTEFPIYLSTSTIKDEAGKIVAMVGISNDITEQKRSEEQLIQTKQTFVNIFNTITESIYVLDENGHFLDVNKGAEIMYGYAHDELIGQSPVTVAAPNKNNLDDVFAKMELTATTGKPVRFEFWAKRKNGEIFPKDVVVNKGIYFGKERLIAVARDITDQKRDELLKEIIYKISQAANTDIYLDELIDIIKNQLNKIIDVNNFFVAFYNETEDTFSSPYMHDEKDHFDTWPAGKSITAYVYRSGSSKLLTKKDLLKLEKSGEIEIIGTLPEVWLGVPLKIKGKLFGVFVVQNYTDKNAFSKYDLEMLEFVSHQMSISIERKKTEAELREAYEKAMESDRLKSAFLATMSHELRTPLNAIIGFSDLIKEKQPMDTVLKYSNIVNQSGRHLLEIVEDLFDVTLLEIGQVNINKDYHSLNSIIESVSVLVDSEKKKSGSELPIHYNPELKEDLNIYTDKSKLKQILVNLLKNALKFTQRGYIEYGYRKIEINGVPLLKFYVKDTGIGIAKAEQEFIFDMFRQVDETLTRFYGGTGIGLNVVKRFTEILGGTVALESELGKGSTFYVTIPYTAENNIHEQEDEIFIDKNTDLSNKTILIVEDDKISSELLIELLDAFKFNYITAKNGAEAMKICSENNNINLVLMDIKMPNMNGYEATKIIKKKRPELVIVAQTAHAMQGDRDKALQAGCNDYITKPIQHEDIERIIKTYLMD